MVSYPLQTLGFERGVLQGIGQEYHREETRFLVQVGNERRGDSFNAAGLDEGSETSTDPFVGDGAKSFRFISNERAKKERGLTGTGKVH